MQKLDFITILLNAIAPIAVIVSVIIIIKGYLKKEVDLAKIKLLEHSKSEVLPIRLQAYERLGLLLERINPTNLLQRLNKGIMPAKEFHLVLINEIRSEFNHNISQQVYISDPAWKAINNTTENIIGIINLCAEGISEEENNIHLSKKIIEHLINKERNPIEDAMSTLKSELSELF